MCGRARQLVYDVFLFYRTDRRLLGRLLCRSFLLAYTIYFGALGGTRTHNTYDLNVVRMPIPPPGHGSRKGIRTLVPFAGRTDFQSGRLDQLSHPTMVPLEGFEPSVSWLRRPAPIPLAEVLICLSSYISFSHTACIKVFYHTLLNCFLVELSATEHV